MKTEKTLIEVGMDRIADINWIIVCSDSPDGYCKEDMNGICYYCGREMTE